MPESIVAVPARSRLSLIFEVLLFLYPISLAANKSANDVLSALLLLTACLALLSKPQALLGALREARWGWLIALTMPLALVIIQHFALAPPLSLRDVDDYSRFFLCAPVYLAALSLRPRVQWFLWGCVAFALYSTGLMVVHFQFQHLGRDIFPNGFLAVIPHTSLAIILAFVGLQVRAHADGGLRYRFLLPVLVGCALALPLLTQTRSGILLVLALGAVLWRLTPGRQLRWLFGAVAVALLVVAATLSNKQMWSRSDHTVAEIHQYVTAPVPPPLTSATTRIELWRLAIKMVEAHPLIGVGNHRFRTALAELQARGQTPKDLELYSHPHNDLLKMSAEGGLLGSLCWALLLLFPLRAALRGYGAAPGAANPATAVILLAVGVILAGMVDVVLIWRPTIMFYGVAMSVLLARVAQQPPSITIDT